MNQQVIALKGTCRCLAQVLIYIKAMMVNHERMLKKETKVMSRKNAKAIKEKGIRARSYFLKQSESGDNETVSVLNYSGSGNTSNNTNRRRTKMNTRTNFWLVLIALIGALTMVGCHRADIQAMESYSQFYILDISTDSMSVPSAGTAPFLVDLDSNGTMDLVLGTADGHVYFVYNDDPAGLHVSRIEGVYDQDGNEINVGNNAVAVVLDLFSNNTWVIVTGNGAGEVSALIKNNDSDTWGLYQGVDANGDPIVAPGGYAVPTLADIDGDGLVDLLLGAGDGNVYYYRNVGNSQLIAVGDMGINVGQKASPVAYDFNGDGIMDLLIGNSTGDVRYYNSTTGELFPLILNRSDSWGAVKALGYVHLTVGDVNHDGQVDIVGGVENDRLYYLPADPVSNGQPVEKSQLQPTIEMGIYYQLGQLTSADTASLPEAGDAPFLVDLDFNGTMDLVLGTADGHVYFVYNDDPTGLHVARIEGLYDQDGNEINVGNNAVPVAVDLFSNNTWVIITGNGAGEVSALIKNSDSDTWGLYQGVDANGDPIVAPGGYAVPTLADIDGDGLVDLLLGAGDGNVYYYRNIGNSQLIAAGDMGINVGQNASPVAGDFNKDGIIDLLIGNAAGDVMYYNASSGELFPFIFNSPYAWGTLNISGYVHPAAADINSDGQIDIVIGVQDLGIGYFPASIR